MFVMFGCVTGYSSVSGGVWDTAGETTQTHHIHVIKWIDILSLDTQLIILSTNEKCLLYCIITVQY